MKIYLDHSATTPVDKKVIQTMQPYFADVFGNASSIHTFGQEAVAGVDQARKKMADFFNCQTKEIVFTSGATESNNLAINGIVRAVQKRYKKNKQKNKIHIITSIIEHDAILEPCLNLEREGIEITYLPVESNGMVDLEKLKKAIKDNTVLITIMYVNSEVGIIQPLREIGKIIKKNNQKKLKDWQKASLKNRGEKPTPILFHTDATQGVNFLSCDIKYLHLDLLSMSGHKIYGPKGVGALFVREGAEIQGIQLGGHHENNLRSGTLNTTGIIGMGRAIELLNSKNKKANWKEYDCTDQQEKENQKIAQIRDLLIDGIIKNIPDTILNTDLKHATPAHAHFTFLGVEGESILISLDLEGIAVSTGSACASGSLKASHVLLAMGIKKEIAHNSIRFTLGKNTTKIEIKKVLEVLPKIIKRLRKINPLYS